MMTDREMLELAAKAHGSLEYVHDCDAWIHVDAHGARGAWWYPQEDDGDALRLAVKLDLDVFQAVTYQEVQVVGALKSTVFEGWGSDKYAATRRAIVRAAAEIGKAMK